MASVSVSFASLSHSIIPIFSIVQILLSKSKMHQCHTNCCLLCSCCVVSSHNTAYSPFEREHVGGRDQIMVSKETMLTAVPLTEKKSKLLVHS